MIPSIPDKVRDHLANERTFLAWVRTSISLLGFGVLIARLRMTSPGNAPIAHLSLAALLTNGSRTVLLGCSSASSDSSR